MEKIIVYPYFAGVDTKNDKEFNAPVKNISLDNLIINEKYKTDNVFKTVEKKKYLDKMEKNIDDLPPILVIKHPLISNKYSILDGHHRFQLFKKLRKNTIPAMVIDYKNIFLAKKEYGAKNNTATRLDKIVEKDFDLKKYFNTESNQEEIVKEDITEKWSEKYKRSIDCNNPKGFSQRAHCEGKKKKATNENKLKGGLSDNLTLDDIAEKHNVNVENLKIEFNKGLKIEMEHTSNKKIAKEIAMDHLVEDPKYYSKLKKIESNESMGADSAGAFEGPAFGSKTILKRNIHKLHNFSESEEEVIEATDASSSGSYDVPLFGGTKGRKNPLSIGGPESIKSSRAVKDKKFPKWGGPGGVFIKIKEKCKKYPYCNQGDINAIELLEMTELTEPIKNISKLRGIPYKDLEDIVINEIKQIFINYECK
jgi:hypothetical protein